MAETVKDLMVEPVTVSSDTTLTEAAQLMRDEAIGDVIVSDDGHAQGMVTDRDIVVRALAERLSPEDTTVADICSQELASVGPDDDVSRAVALMRQSAIRRLPVVDRDTLVGVLSIGDLAIELDERSALADISAAEPNT